MLVRLIFIPIIFAGIFHIGSAQEKSQFADYDFTIPDSIAKYVSSKHVRNPYKISHLLTDSLTTDIDKARAIFQWVKMNVAYDTKKYWKIKKDREKRQFRSLKHKIRWVKKHNNRIIRHTINRGKAVCQGYASTFDYLCALAGLHTELIRGHAKGKIGKTTKSDHVWNAIRINNNWYLLDATWASGYTDEEVETFYRRSEDFYFLTDPALFNLNHYPKDKKWLLYDDPISIREFFNAPDIGAGYRTNQLTSYFPKHGVLRFTTDSSATIRFTTAKVRSIHSVIIVPKSKKLSPFSTPVHYDNGVHSFKLNILRPGRYYLYIVINGKMALGYFAVVDPPKRILALSSP